MEITHVRSVKGDAERKGPGDRFLWLVAVSTLEQLSFWPALPSPLKFLEEKAAAL
jgi:hypothetical protein